MGTVSGLNLSITFGLIGIQILPVFGCTQNGDFSKWFNPFVTFTSSLGYAKYNKISSTQFLVLKLSNPCLNNHKY